MDIKDKEIRKELIARYLDAETSFTEEKLLADYYACNEADEDELAVARMVRMEKIHAHLLSDEGVEEFDAIVRRSSSRSSRLRRTMVWVGSMAAAIALYFVWNPVSTSRTSFDATEVAQNMQQIMNLEMDGVLSITATPVDGHILLEAELENGFTKTFIMSKDEELGTTSLLAIN